MDTKTTRLPVDLIEAAEAEGREEHRSTSKQLEHWARFGMFFDRQTSSHRRIRRVMAGEASLADLDEGERVVANAAISAVISTGANEASFADRLAARGVTTVVMNDSGQMIRRHPDGSTTIL